MSYDIFKQNMLVFMRNQPNIAFKEQFAKKLVQEYDALIKRGFDTLNGITLQEGNTAAMEQVLNGVLNTAFQQSSGEHAIITNMGKAFQAYWTPTSGIGGLLGAILELIDEDTGVPNDNNTVEGVAVLASTTSASIINDSPDPDIKIRVGESATGLKMDPKLTEVKQQTSKKDPVAPEVLGTFKNEAVASGKAKTIPVTCPTKEQIFLKNGKVNYELQLSPNIKLKDVTTKSIWPHNLKDMDSGNGRYKRLVNVTELVCNLKSLAVNIIEPLLAEYPGFMNPVEGKSYRGINSAFRASSTRGGKSQHMVGEAIDVQWLRGSGNGSNYSTEKYIEISNWILKNLPVDQLIYEHTNVYGKVWLHISHSRGGVQRTDNAWTMYKSGGNEVYVLGFFNRYPSK